MVKIIHTSDWHLGAKLHDQDRGEEHAAFLRFLLDALREERPDALVVAGDVFDIRQPGNAAQTLYYDFLAEAVRDRLCGKIIAIAGNHDSAAMLSAAGRLLDRLGVSIVAKADADVSGEALSIRSRDGADVLGVAAIPFISAAELSNFAHAQGCAEAAQSSAAPRDARDARAMEDDGFAAHCAAAIAAARAAADGAPVVALGHCTLRGALLGDVRSERAARLGGLDARPPEAFSGAAYVALGHLHNPQELDGGAQTPRMRYCGSPLAMSFAEAGRAKSLTVAEFSGGAANVAIREIPIPQFVPLAALEGSRQEISDALAALVASRPRIAYASAKVTAGEGDLFPYWGELDSLVQGSGVRLLLKEDARVRDAAARQSPEDAVNLESFEPREIARMRIAEEPGLTEDERAEYLEMVDGAIAEAAAI